jgi:phosphopantetheinyl transferase
VQVSLAHKNNVAVAMARYGKAVGIDIEEIQERGAGFNDLVFRPEELALLQGRDQAEWITRCWVAKEAYGKYLGKGLQGNPKAYVVEAIEGGNLRIKDVIITTVKHNNYIIGWTS